MTNQTLFWKWLLLAALLAGTPPTAAQTTENGPGDAGEAASDLDALDELDPSFFEDDIEPGEPDPEAAVAVVVADPFEPFNRTMFNMNDWIYGNVLAPVSKGYVAIMPDPFEKGIDNFFDNLQFPIRLVNNTLQGNLEEAGKETGRFLVDSTVGFFGFFKPSKDIPELQTADVDMGITFGVWGFDHGAYLVLPIFGPTSIRDVAGRIGDGFLDPVRLLEDNDEIQVGLNVLDFLNASDELLQGYNRVVEGSLDPYAAFKDIYIQNRNQKLTTKRDRALNLF